MEKSTPNKFDISPFEWETIDNPSFAYYLFYIRANLESLNYLKVQKNKGHPWIFRPSSGFLKSEDLAVSYLLSDSIVHGNLLHSEVTLQYLYYLSEIGISSSIIKENCLVIDYQNHPFKVFFKRGLNISVSTGSPLLLHLSDESLTEEYAITSQIWKLNTADIREIAKNSVDMLGLPKDHKMKMLCRDENVILKLRLDRPLDFSKKSRTISLSVSHYDPNTEPDYITGLPESRLVFRKKTLSEEHKIIEQIVKKDLDSK